MNTQLIALYAHLARIHWHHWMRYHCPADRARSARMMARARALS